ALLRPIGGAMSRQTDGQTLSLWLKGGELPDLPRLEGDIETDVCIIGAGIAGLSTAYAVARAGRRVVVIDGIGLCGGQTGRGTALRFPRQAQLNPLQYASGLAAAVERHGGQLYGKTRAAALIEGTPSHIECAHGPTITADVVVVATNTPVNDLAVVHTKQAPY